MLPARRTLLLPLLLVASPAGAQLGARYTDPPLTITLPAGFEPFRPTEDRHPAVIDTFRSAPSGARGPLVVQLLRLDGELPQRALRADERPAFRVGAPFTFDDRPEVARAMGFEVPASAGRGRTPSSASVLRLAALLPTPRNAVQVSVLARAEDEAAARGVLRAVLASARGEVTWRTAGQRAFLALASVSAALATLGTLVIVVRVLLEGRTTHMGPRAQRWIARATGLGWAVLAAWLLFPLEGAEWAAAVPVLALAVTFSARGWAPRSAT